MNITLCDRCKRAISGKARTYRLTMGDGRKPRDVYEQLRNLDMQLCERCATEVAEYVRRTK